MGEEVAVEGQGFQAAETPMCPWPPLVQTMLWLEEAMPAWVGAWGLGHGLG